MKKDILVGKITTYQPILMPDISPSAAVMVILLEEDDHEILHMVLTKRSKKLPTYAGDYCFPGGVKDDNDSDLKATAMREVQEELGLASSSYEIIGQLDDFADRYGNLVRPFVACMLKKKFKLYYKSSLVEISNIYYFPLNELDQFKENESLAQITHRRPSYVYIHNEVTIWGLTASIIVHFRKIVFGQE